MVRTLCGTAGAEVRFPIRDLRSHMAQGQAKRITTTKTSPTRTQSHFLFCFWAKKPSHFFAFLGSKIPQKEHLCSLSISPLLFFSFQIRSWRFFLPPPPLDHSCQGHQNVHVRKAGISPPAAAPSAELSQPSFLPHSTPSSLGFQNPTRSWLSPYLTSKQLLLHLSPHRCKWIFPSFWAGVVHSVSHSSGQRSSFD